MQIPFQDVFAKQCKKCRGQPSFFAILSQMCESRRIPGIPEFLLWENQLLDLERPQWGESFSEKGHD